MFQFLCKHEITDIRVNPVNPKFLNVVPDNSTIILQAFFPKFVLQEGIW